MKSKPVSRLSSSIARPLVGCGLFGIALAIASCGGSGGSGSSSHPAGTILGFNGTHVIVDENQGGTASTLHIRSVEWGRLVDIKDLSGDTIFHGIVIRDDITTQGDFTLDFDPATNTESLTIKKNFADPSFKDRLEQALHLQQVLSKSLDPGELPPFTALPRNCAALITFDDLLKASTITASNLRILTGYTPTTFFEARIVPDPNHGDTLDTNGDGKVEFYTTRVILDMTVSKEESAASNSTLAVNPLGLPEASVVSQPNVAFRIATRIDTASSQFGVLQNLNGANVSFTGNGPNDPFSPTLDVVRALRSMGSTAVTGDPGNGFLLDKIPPQILGEQAVGLSGIVDDPSSTNVGDVLVDLSFASPTCAQTVRVGDVLETTVNGKDLVAVGRSLSNPPSNGVVSAASFRINRRIDPLTGLPEDDAKYAADVADFMNASTANYKTTWDSALGVPPACFVHIAPDPGTAPSGDISTQSTMTVQFSEPMDPASVAAFDTFTLTRTNNTGTALRNNVIGAVVPSVDLTAFTFTPSLPLTHSTGTSEVYNLNVFGGASGVHDLAGNALADSLPGITLTVEPTQPTENTNGYVLKFSSIDEDVPVFGGVAVNFPTPEVRGQQLYDFSRGIVKPRPVSHFAGIADPSVPIVGAMIKFTAPIQTPLSNLGSKMMGLWRYHDVGFSLIDETTMNVDVEGLNWTPFGGGVIVDQYPQFQVSLTHSAWLPDEVLLTTLLPKYPASGVVANFTQNIGDPVKDPLFAIHPKDYGYLVTPADDFVAASGTFMHAWPVNRQIPAGKSPMYYTWRDTAVLTLAAKGGGGADTERLGVISPPSKTYYKAGKVPTVGLPLLMEFRCYPSDSALGLNGFQIAIAINSSAAPYFRAFSTGGILSSGQAKKIDPDNEPTAEGGINPGTGVSTPPLDNSFYYGQGDFVVRVSRMHSIWFDTNLSAPTFFAPIVEPPASSQPAGTQIVIAYRGASTVTTAPTAGNRASYINGDNFDFYGDWKSTAIGLTSPQFIPSFFPNATDPSWSSSLTALSGAKLFQFRVSFISNVDTGLSPELSALGFPFQN